MNQPAPSPGRSAGASTGGLTGGHPTGPAASAEPAAPGGHGADERQAQQAAWDNAVAAAELLAVDPHGLGGVILRAGAGPVRDRWLALLRRLLPACDALRRMPGHIADERLLGGLDLAATLAQGRPVAQRGLLAEAHGGLVLVPMAERLSGATAARLAAVLDSASIGFERDGIGARWDARIGVVICDEGGADDGPIAPALVERLAFCIDLRALSLRDLSASDDLLEAERAGAVLSARERLAAVTANDKLVQALCGTAMQLGVAPLRASLLALRAARASAALAGHAEADDEDGLLAARLVLAPRATRLPAPPPEADEAPPPDNPPPEATPPEDSPPPDTAPEPPPPEDTPPADPKDDPQDDPENKPQGLEDRLVEATVAALPAGLLAALQAGALERPGAQAGRVGALAASPRSGRPVGVRRGEPRGGARLNLVETLRAAAPWQRLRRAAADAKAMATDPGSASAAGPGTSPSLDNSAPPRIYVNADDLRISRLQQRAGTATLFVVDASGSAALQRLSEAKGAVNLLLADCYVRRDEVAVIAFRGRSAELLLAPTRSLVRAKRSLASLPGGGGTPLASGLEAALRLAEQVRRGGAAPIIVLLTDGRANIARDGEPGRARAEEDALAMARLLRAGGFTSMVVDTSPQPAAAAKRLAQAMAAQYRALPYAGAQALSAAVRALPRGAG